MPAESMCLARLATVWVKRRWQGSRERVDLRGLEPPAARVSDRLLCQLSYRAVAVTRLS